MAREAGCEGCDACGRRSQALSLGADAVTVSNHGGNKHDCMVAALDALPDIAALVGNKAPVFFDGGIRRGADIVIASALGAGSASPDAPRSTASSPAVKRVLLGRSRFCG